MKLLSGRQDRKVEKEAFWRADAERRQAWMDELKKAFDEDAEPAAPPKPRRERPLRARPRPAAASSPVAIASDTGLIITIERPRTRR